MRQQFGIVASDPLRLLGLQTFFEKREADAITLTGDDAAAFRSVSLTLIDAACTPQLFELVSEFRHLQPTMKLIVVGLSQDSEFIEKVIWSGAKGYLTHQAKEEEILMAIDIVLDGSVWAPRKVLAKLLERDRLERERRLAAPPLTIREREVLDLLVDGLSNREIGQALTINEATVKAHVGRLMRKAGVKNRTALSLRAVDWKNGSGVSAAPVEPEGDAAAGL